MIFRKKFFSKKIDFFRKIFSKKNRIVHEIEKNGASRSVSHLRVGGNDVYGSKYGHHDDKERNEEDEKDERLITDPLSVGVPFRHEMFLTTGVRDELEQKHNSYFNNISKKKSKNNQKKIVRIAYFRTSCWIFHACVPRNLPYTYTALQSPLSPLYVYQQPFVAYMCTKLPLSSLHCTNSPLSLLCVATFCLPYVYQLAPLSQYV